MVKSIMVFVDGENLTSRFQEMAKGGRTPTSDVVHLADSFVWAPKLTEWSELDVIRVLYYTSVVGDDDRVAAVTKTIGETLFRVRAGGVVGTAKVIPRVHKRLSNSRKTKVVDVDITIDVMRAALTMPIDGICLLSGDGDYLQLVREITRTSKQVYVGAFSSGLDKRLTTSVEHFLDLDAIFFLPAKARPIE